MKTGKNVTRLVIAMLGVFVGIFFWMSQRGVSSKRVILVTVDTLRADHLGAYGYPRPVSPFLDSLASDGIVFTKAFSAAPHTAPSHASIFTSLYPFQHNLLRNQETLNPELFNLKKFADHIGWEPYGFSAVKFMEGKVGFPHIDKISNVADANFKKFWYRGARNIIDNTIAVIDQRQDKDLLLWLHFYDVHEWASSKNIPPQYFERVMALPQKEHAEFLIKNRRTPLSFFGTEEKLLKAMNGYDARIMYVDDELKRLSQYLKSHDLLNETLWIITSDHGEGLGNHNYKGHGEFLYQEQLHVPLIISQSGALKQRRIDSLVRTIDIFPTLAEMLGSNLKEFAPDIEGISLKPLIDGGAGAPVKHSFAERRPKDTISFRRTWEEGEIYSLHDLEHKYVEHSLGTDEYYDLTADPFEEINKDGVPSPRRDALKSELQNFFDPSKRKEGISSEEPHTPEEIEELKSLGYL